MYLLLNCRRLRSRLDALHTNLAERVEQGQKAAHDTKAGERSFQEQDSVYVKYYERGDGWKWLSGKIVKCKGPLSFDVWLEDGKVCRRHQDQIRKRADEAYDTWTGDRSSTDVATEDQEQNGDRAQDEQEALNEDVNNLGVGDRPEIEKKIDQENQRRYPSRDRR